MISTRAFAARTSWTLLCMIAGGPCAFLALEGIGIPITLVVIAGLIFVGVRRNVLAETMLGFGLPYGFILAKFAVPDLADSVQQNQAWMAAYFAGHLAVGLGLLGIGMVALLRREVSRS